MQLTFALLGFTLAHISMGAPQQTSSSSPVRRSVDNLPPSDMFVACPKYRYSRSLSLKCNSTRHRQHSA